MRFLIEVRHTNNEDLSAVVGEVEAVDIADAAVQAVWSFGTPGDRGIAAWGPDASIPLHAYYRPSEAP